MEQEQDLEDDPDFKIYDPKNPGLEDDDDDLEAKTKNIEKMFRQVDKD